MPEAVINLIKGDAVGSETDYRDALPVNMLTIPRKVLGVDGYMIQAPGLTQYGTSSGVTHGAVNNERFHELYRVQGRDLVEVSPDGTVTVLGQMAEVVGSCAMPYSFNTQGIVSAGRFYLYSPTGGFQEVTDPDLGSPIDCVWVDGYYFFTDGEYIYHTDIDDEASIDPLKFATAEFMPDDTKGVAKTQDNKVMVFGRYTIEYFVNQASENFAFSRLPTRAIKVGIVATHAKVEVDGVWYIVGNRESGAFSVFAVTVGQSAKVASREVEKIIGQYREADLQNVLCEVIKDEGIALVVVHLPNETLVYNTTIAQMAGADNAWSILKSDVWGEEQWRAKHCVFHPEKGDWVCGDKQDGRLGIIDWRNATHYGDLAEWILYTPWADIERGSVDELNIETVPGFTSEDDATVFISLTYDGHFWGKEWTLHYGRPGEYGKRFIAYRLGYIREKFAVRLRGATRSRMAFSRAKIRYG